MKFVLFIAVEYIEELAKRKEELNVQLGEAKEQDS